MVGPLNGPQVRDKLLMEGKMVAEGNAYFWGNLTKSVQDSSKGAITVDSSKRAATGTYKAGKDFSRGDSLCGGLCCISIGCEVLSGVFVWCPIPGKVMTISVLKAGSISCQKFRDLCSQDASSPFC
jgi:hypothetical protein